MAIEIKAGDTVKLKSGGPTMTVSKLKEWKGVMEARCEWFDGNTRGQASTTTRMLNAKIPQGDNISMDLTLDKAPNVGGSIGVTAFPEGAVNGGISMGCNIASGSAKCTAGVSVPLDAKLGKWVISEITFQPYAGTAKTLAKHGDTSFEVVAHGELILPDGATVSDIK
jgi:uncharacterized protein YodC (DUF2158 family)